MCCKLGPNPKPYQHGVQAHGLAARDVPQAVIAEQRRRCVGVVRSLQSQLDRLHPRSTSTVTLPAVETG